MQQAIRTQESRVRRLAQREGYRVHRSRRAVSIYNHGEFMLIENDRNIVALGGSYDASLDEIEAFLSEDC